jgi:hypothetical protein
MSCLKHRGKARTIFLALSSAHHVVKGVDQLPASSINEGHNLGALIVQLLAFGTNSQIVSKVSSKRTDIYDGLTPSFISRKMALFLDTLLYDTLGLRWLSDR